MERFAKETQLGKKASHLILAALGPKTYKTRALVPPLHFYATGNWHTAAYNQHYFYNYMSRPEQKLEQRKWSKLNKSKDPDDRKRVKELRKVATNMMLPNNRVIVFPGGPPAPPPVRRTSSRQEQARQDAQEAELVAASAERARDPDVQSRALALQAPPCPCPCRKRPAAEKEGGEEVLFQEGQGG